MVDMSDLQALKLLSELHRQEVELVRLRGVVLEIEHLRVENRFLFEVIQNDALLVERYNAFKDKKGK